jgi:uncharacterized protein YjbJ (UPF0337 family)
MWDDVPIRVQPFPTMALVWHLLHMFNPFTFTKVIMNKEQIKGTVKDLTGKAQEAVGKAIDDHEIQRKGIQKQAIGNAEKAIGDAKQGVKNVSDAMKHASKSL